MVLSRVAGLYTALSLLSLSGCAFNHDKDKKLLIDEGNWLGQINYYKKSFLEEKFSDELRDRRLPSLGLALAGGGTKASAFSIGVLQGLTETQLMDEVDIVSSVSGGGYAALWYYSRMLFDIQGIEDNINSVNGQMNQFFSDCLPTRYWKTYNIKEIDGLAKCPESGYTNYTAGTEDKYRYQNYLRGYQDIFSSDRNLLYDGAFNYATTGEDNRFAVDAGTLIATSVAVMPLGLLMNGLFDWEIDVSMSQHSYNYGIARAYGASPKRCNNKEHGCEGTEKNQVRREGFVEQGKTLSFDELKMVYEKKDAPLWIINATAGEDRSPLDFSGQKDINLTAFEITPYASGSGLYGYKSFQLEGITPYQATVASAAFLDSQQKVVTQPPIRNFAAFLMKATTLSWGTSYRNRLGKTYTNEENANFKTHMILPWPLYYFHKFAPGRDSVFIHLSDGGQSENLGAYALVRRGVPAIIISDHAQDRLGTMGDICRLKSQLKDQNLEVQIPGLENLDKVCVQDKQNPLGYDIFKWNHPVLLGCIASKSIGSVDCHRDPHRIAVDGEYFSRLFIIKPALANPELLKSIRAVATACQSGEGNECGAAISNACHAPNVHRDEKTPWSFSGRQSCELIGFMMRNAFVEDGIASDGCPHFPQHPTVMMTADSSPWMYGAMRDLGAYYASQIKWFFVGNHTDQVDERRFNEAMDYQAQNPLHAADMQAVRSALKKPDFLKCLSPHLLKATNF